MEFSPSPDLRPWIDRYWIRSATEEDTAVTVLPDGCADVVLDLGGSPGALGAIFAVGAMTRPLHLSLRGSPEMLGIRFRPGRAAAFFREPLSSITDLRAPLHDLCGNVFPLVAEQLAKSHTARRLAIVEDWLRKRLEPVKESRVDAAIDALTASGGRAAVEHVAREIGVSRQHLARLFDLHVGLTPKMFARVVRFRRAIALGGTLPWAEVAATLGYADQSHLIAEFQEFAGSSPVPFFLSTGSARR